MRVFEQGSRPRIGIIFMIGIAGFVVASIGLALSVIYVQGAKIRQTERIIYTQGSALASEYRTVLQLHTQDSASLDAYGKELTNTFEQTQTSSKTNFQLPERHTALSRFGDPVHPPLADPVAGKPADHVALDVGKTLLPSLVKAENVTNSTIHITDYNGVVVASNTLDTGLLLSDEIGVQRALNGDHLSFMRQMSVSDDSRVVFTAVPIVQNNRLLGTVVLTRAPPNPIADLFGNTTDTESYYHYGSRVSRYIILTFIVIIGGALLFVLVITRPIRRLIRQTQQITAGSRITDIQVPLFAAREIDDLRTAITNMDEALRNDAKYVQTLAHHASHEFKTPIAAITNTVDVLEDDWDAMPPEKRQHFLSNINKSSERLLDLVNDLSKISTARNLKPDETARANVNDVLTSILSLNSSHQLQIETNKDVSDVNMEPELLNSIVTSIIENAKRHGGDDVNIKVTSKFNDTNKTVQLQVSNDGKSIPEDISDRIFEPFFSTVRDYTRKSGSGLAYVKALLIAHGGDITLLPIKDKVTFELTIPT